MILIPRRFTYGFVAILTVLLLLLPLTIMGLPNKKSLPNVPLATANARDGFIQGDRRIYFDNGAWMIEEQTGISILQYTNMCSPSMVVSWPYIALYEYPSKNYYLLQAESKIVQEKVASCPVSGLRISAKGDVLWWSEMSFKAGFLNQNGKKYDISCHSPIAGAAISQNGKYVALLMLLTEQRGAYHYELFSTKNGKRLNATTFSSEVGIDCFLEGKVLYLYRNQEVFACLDKRGRFRFFKENS